jgi:hypothetical protein
MGFWKNLFTRNKTENKKLNLAATQESINVFVPVDTAPTAPEVTVWEAPTNISVDLDKTLEKVEELLKEVAPKQDQKLIDEAAKKAKNQERAKKAAMTRAINKAKKEAELAAQIVEAQKSTKPKKK